MDRSMAEVGVLAHRTAVSFRFSPQKRNKGKKQTKQTNRTQQQRSNLFCLCPKNCLRTISNWISHLMKKGVSGLLLNMVPEARKRNM